MCLCACLNRAIAFLLTSNNQLEQSGGGGERACRKSNQLQRLMLAARARVCVGDCRRRRNALLYSADRIVFGSTNGVGEVASRRERRTELGEVCVNWRGQIDLAPLGKFLPSLSAASRLCVWAGGYGSNTKCVNTHTSKRAVISASVRKKSPTCKFL